MQQAAMLAPLLAGAVAGLFSLSGGVLLWWRRRRSVPALGLAAAPALAGPAKGRTQAAAADDFEARLRRAAPRP